jgi:hypothetical protein
MSESLRRRPCHNKAVQLYAAESRSYSLTYHLSSIQVRIILSLRYVVDNNNNIIILSACRYPSPQRRVFTEIIIDAPTTNIIYLILLVCDS